jgi:hypothetical protein
MFTCVNSAFLPVLVTCLKYANAEKFQNSIQMPLTPVIGTTYGGLSMKQDGEDMVGIQNFDTEASWKLYTWKTKKDITRNFV